MGSRIPSADRGVGTSALTNAHALPPGRPMQELGIDEEKEHHCFAVHGWTFEESQALFTFTVFPYDLTEVQLCEIFAGRTVEGTFKRLLWIVRDEMEQMEWKRHKLLRTFFDHLRLQEQKNILRHFAKQRHDRHIIWGVLWRKLMEDATATQAFIPSKPRIQSARYLWMLYCVGTMTIVELHRPGSSANQYLDPFPGHDMQNGWSAEMQARLTAKHKEQNNKPVRILEVQYSACTNALIYEKERVEWTKINPEWFVGSGSPGEMIELHVVDIGLQAHRNIFPQSILDECIGRPENAVNAYLEPVPGGI